MVDPLRLNNICNTPKLIMTNNVSIIMKFVGHILPIPSFCMDIKIKGKVFWK